MSQLQKMIDTFKSRVVGEIYYHSLPKVNELLENDKSITFIQVLIGLAYDDDGVNHPYLGLYPVTEEFLSGYADDIDYDLVNEKAVDIFIEPGYDDTKFVSLDVDEKIIPFLTQEYSGRLFTILPNLEVINNPEF